MEKDYNLPMDKKNLAIKRTPLMIGQQGLNFGNILEEDVTKLTDDQKAKRFLSKYQEVVDPIVTYEDYFHSSAKSIDFIFKEIKTYYKKLVLESGWTERKYVASVNNILENKMIFGIMSLDRSGLFYDRGLLDKNERRDRSPARGERKIRR